MKLHRFIGNFDFMHPPVRITDAELMHQIRNVLRLRTGDEFLLADGKGNEARVSVTVMNKGVVEVAVKNLSRNDNEPSRHVTLYASILKRELTEWVAQKATEVGVHEIVLIQSERTVKLSVNEERLQKIVKEAAEQSGRAVVPRVRTLETLSLALREARPSDAIFFFDASGMPWEKAKKVKKGERITIFVGPEGGWTREEVLLGERAGATVVNLGSLTLRAETAAVIGTFLAVQV